MQAESTTITIYALTDPRTDAVHYIGQSRDYRARYWFHTNKPETTGRAKWLNDLKDSGLLPTLVPFEVVFNPEDADERERWWIALGRSLSWPLLNITPGGNYRWLNAEAEAKTRLAMRASHLGKRPSAETLAKLVIARRGSKRSDETKAKMSAAQLGKRHTDIAKAKMTAWRTGRPLSDEHRAALSAVRKGRPKSQVWRDKMRVHWDKQRPTTKQGGI